MERCKGGPGALNEPGFYNELETQRSLRSRERSRELEAFWTDVQL